MKKEKDAEIRAQLVKIIGDAPSCAAMGAEFIPWLSDASSRVAFQTAIALGKMKTTKATDALLKLAADNNDKDAYLRHAVVTGLEGCATAEQLKATLKNPSRAVRLASVLALRRQGSPAVATFLKDKNATVATEAARAIHDDLSINDALPALAAMVDEGSSSSDPLLRRALNAAFRIGDAANAGRVLKFAMRDDADPALRELAFTLAQNWTEPPPLDIVDGRARKHEMREVGIIAGAVAPHVEAIMTLKIAKLKALGIQVITQNKIPVAANLAAAAVMTKEAPTEVRVEALKMLAQQHPDYADLGHTLDALFADAKTPEKLRLEALDAMLTKDKARAVTEAIRLLSKGKASEMQHAVTTLASAATAEADAELATQLDKLVDGMLAPALQLEVIEATQERSEAVPAIREKLAVFEKPRAALAGTPAAFAECLDGGDATAGKKVIQENLAANCLACHKFEKRDTSNVGPPLDKIGGQRDRAYLLEALVAPQAKIAPGFGLITVTLKKGDPVIGALASANEKEVQVRLADGKTQKIAVADIASKTEPVTVMPPMGTILNKRQIRDVVAYLGSLKATEKKKAKAEH